MKNQQIKPNEQLSNSRGLFWFRHDLRLHDNVAFNTLCDEVDEATFVYVMDSRLYSKSTFGFSRAGAHRQRFLAQTLVDLSKRLAELGHGLVVLSGNPSQCLHRMIKTGHYSHLGYSEHNGLYERQDAEALERDFPSLTFVKKNTFSLFDEQSLPFSIENMPDVFSPFRRKVEKYCSPLEVCDAPVSLPTVFMPDGYASATVADLGLDTDVLNESGDTLLSTVVLPNLGAEHFVGGESAALTHLSHYLFEWRAASTYKETRNALDSWQDSTKFSPWLAHGALSVREVVRQVTHYEQTVEKNESTYWIYFELLWREFFYWLQKKYDARYFSFSGIQGKTPNTSHDEEVFESWCNGQTGYPIVDACMNQLAQTGYMSNRGRQLVASCFVHELRQDWRYGAAWFEHQLIDFDVGSNWGNWLYLAGVGSDPRGHRQFNLQKQTETYDRDGRFCSKWRTR